MNTRTMTTQQRTWAIFHFWFNKHGHWLFDATDAGRARAIAAWKKYGIHGLPDFPGDE